jgi:hypothetical protein
MSACCNQGWVCEPHRQPSPYAGWNRAGDPCDNPECPWWKGPSSAALQLDRSFIKPDKDRTDGQSGRRHDQTLPAGAREHRWTPATRWRRWLARPWRRSAPTNRSPRACEAGWPLHNVSHMLGHANIAQTSTYLNATRVGLQDPMRRLNASRSKTVASEGQTERASLRNEQTENTTQALVN